MYILREGQPIITPEVQTIINCFKNQFSELFLAGVSKCKRIIQSKESLLKKKAKDTAKKLLLI